VRVLGKFRGEALEHHPPETQDHGLLDCVNELSDAGFSTIVPER